MAIQRGCGTRETGGIYAELELMEGGAPVEDFLVCPPVVVTDWPNVKPIGVTLIEREGVTHLIDWIGSTHYPNPADFIEEVARFGLSRRLKQTIDFSALTSESRILCVHSRAHVEGVAAPCPKSVVKKNHTPCVGATYYDLVDGEPITLPIGETDVKVGHLMIKCTEGAPLVRRDMPSFSYFGVPELEWRTRSAAIFASFPISRLVVVEDPEGGAHNHAMKRLEGASLPVDLVEE